jgi:hypothetical protein
MNKRCTHTHTHTHTNKHRLFSNYCFSTTTNVTRKRLNIMLYAQYTFCIVVT